MEQVTLEENHFDVIIIGAGISGISAGVGMERCPDKSYIILEGRENLGGTWDLFKYPGIRSDSIKYDFGFSFKNWNSSRLTATSEEILEYFTEVTKERGIDKRIRYNTRVDKASYSSEDNLWLITVTDVTSGNEYTITSTYIQCCTGYYDYENPYTPVFEGEDTFKGEIIHPQFWDDSVDFQDKDVVIIGSGATAISLGPPLSEITKNLVILQRSPTYIVSIGSSVYRLVHWIWMLLPSWLSLPIFRWLSIFSISTLYSLSIQFPKLMKKVYIFLMSLDYPDDVDKKHYTPHYNPWEQRVCLTPEDEFFNALKKGNMSIVTNHIERFVENGILLKNGETLKTDIIITATGLNLEVFSKIEFDIDGVQPKPNEKYAYRGMMINDVPNMIFYVGYPNASWTLKAEMVGKYFGDLLNHMDKNGHTYFCPKIDPKLQEDTKEEVSIFGKMNSGYLLRRKEQLPRVLSKYPWSVPQFLSDYFSHLKFDDKELQYR